MQREREQPRSELKCPWCHTAAGADTVTCPRDRTVIHRECLHEFEICPICHLAVEEEGEAPPVEPSELRLELPTSHWHVHQLPRELRGFGREIRGLYVRSRRQPLVAACAALTALGLGVAGLWLWALIPVVVLAVALTSRISLRPWRPTAAAVTRMARLPVPQPAAAKQLAEGDRRALNALRAHRRASREAQRATQRVRQLVDRRRAIYRTYLANRTPIEEAQQISGIGPGLTDTLRRAGITNLRQLSRANVRQIDGIGPMRARALRAWVADREEAIGRLVEGEQFPGRAQIDVRLEQALATARQRGDRAVSAGQSARTYLERWHAEREPQLLTLCLSKRQPRSARARGRSSPAK